MNQVALSCKNYLHSIGCHGKYIKIYVHVKVSSQGSLFLFLRENMAKSKDKICESVGEIVQPILDSQHIELVDIEFVRMGSFFTWS